MRFLLCLLVSHSKLMLTQKKTSEREGGPLSVSGLWFKKIIYSIVRWSFVASKCPHGASSHADERIARCVTKLAGKWNFGGCGDVWWQLSEMIFKYDLYSLENPYLCIRVAPAEIRFPDKERAVPPREIPIQNRSAFAIYLFFRIICTASFSW